SENGGIRICWPVLRRLGSVVRLQWIGSSWRGLRGQESIAKRLQEDLCYSRVARRAPMTVGKKMNRIGGQRVVEIDADVCEFAEDRRGKAELRSEEIAGALMGQDHSHATRHFFANSIEDEA